MISQAYELWLWVASPGGGRVTVPVIAWCDCDEQQLGRNGFHPVIADGGRARCTLGSERQGATFSTLPPGGRS